MLLAVELGFGLWPMYVPASVVSRLGFEVGTMGVPAGVVSYSGFVSFPICLIVNSDYSLHVLQL